MLPGDDDTKKMIELIESVSADNSGASFKDLQATLLRKINSDNPDFSADFSEKQSSVFDRVEQHKLNEDHKLSTYADQFSREHGMDHKTYTEEWLYKQTGKKICLEKVIENPSFSDFIGVFDIEPQTAYVASKMIIEESDFRGVFDLGTGPSTAELKHTYTEKINEEPEEHAAHIENQRTGPRDASGAETVRLQTCGCSDFSIEPHKLGTGEYLQFQLRKENVVQYLDNSYISMRLRQLIEDESESNRTYGKEPIYVFTVSSNGVVRFHPWGGIQRKLWHAYGDSCSAGSFPLNIAHSAKYGCFCFGITYKEKEDYDINGKKEPGGRTIVMRYNRWATENQPIYAMVRRNTNTESDREVPQQDSCCRHYCRQICYRVNPFDSSRRPWGTFCCRIYSYMRNCCFCCCRRSRNVNNQETRLID